MENPSLLERFRKLPIETKRLLGLGVTLALVAALPLFVWAIVTQRFELRRYATGEVTPSPTSRPVAGECEVCEGLAGRLCAPGLTCLRQARNVNPDQGGICVKPDGTSPCGGTPTATPSATPATLEITARLRFAGVTDGSAEGAKIKFVFRVPAANQDGLETSPVELSYVGEGVYASTFVANPPIPPGGNYIVLAKAEKHLAKKFCQPTGQTPGQRCISLAAISIPSSGKLTFDFTGPLLEPGDVYPQDGRVDSADFDKIKNALDKLCSELTSEEKLTSDLDYSGCVTVKDAFLIRKTLETRYDEN